MMKGPVPAVATEDRPAKRLKFSQVGYQEDFVIVPCDHELLASRATSRPTRIASPHEILDSEAKIGSAIDTGMFSSSNFCTHLEQTLPPVKTDKEAIDEYETLQASDSATFSELHQLLGQHDSVKRKNSIYVDAFNLALETVLEEESHLFNVAEMGVFDAWKSLRYEAQYL